ncbi:YccF domain-containing protein [Pseudoalteromonas sp.]|uniref:YccF domain-containing protein n=1 Tax=Pseudoalteromonas sp. TaxID=53249 RepID=UPI0035679146
MRLLGNIIWFFLGGIVIGLVWWMVSLIAFVSIIGIPWGRACFVIGQFSFFPFGKEAVMRDEMTLQHDIGTGAFGTLGNIIWFFMAGFWLAIIHLLCALMCIITIIGIPFGLQHFKLAKISLMPIGQMIVDIDVAEAMKRRNADAFVASQQQS